MRETQVAIKCECGMETRVHLDPIMEKPIVLKDLFGQLKKDYYEASPICRSHFGLSLEIKEFVTKDEINEN